MNHLLHLRVMPWDMGRFYTHELDGLDRYIETLRKEAAK